jgi:prolyl-tRNA editing enzyme YbaK/EbsC (Cys-tRNA(Pro) deacylase)
MEACFLNMTDPYTKIISLLEEKDIAYTLSEHEHVHTSEEAAHVRGTDMSEGAKSLLLKMEGEYVLVVLPGDRKLSMKKLRAHLKCHKGRFAHPQEVVDVMGCEIGACYPIGSIIPLRTIVDAAFEGNDKVSFNPGIHTKSITMSYQDFKDLGDWEYVAVSE